jgi:hypothetical protein
MVQAAASRVAGEPGRYEGADRRYLTARPRILQKMDFSTDAPRRAGVQDLKGFRRQ